MAETTRNPLQCIICLVIFESPAELRRHTANESTTTARRDVPIVSRSFQQKTNDVSANKMNTLTTIKL
jgi:hypothetical protein